MGFETVGGGLVTEGAVGPVGFVSIGAAVVAVVVKASCLSRNSQALLAVKL